MIAILARGCTLKDKAEVVRFLEGEGHRVSVSTFGEETIVGVIGDTEPDLEARLAGLPGVRETRHDVPPYAYVSREHHPETSRVKVAGVTIGGGEVVVIAGPCSVESEAQLLATARSVAASGARLLRGGAFKPRTSPYGFHGLGEEGLRLLAAAREATGLGIVTEAVAAEDLDLVARYADMIQIGSRNMQNFRLLAACGREHLPVLLKRGYMATIDELLLAAEYIVAAGNPRVVLCERGIRTFETSTRNTLDISAIPVLRTRSHLPVIVDPSHAAGKREWVTPLACAAVAAGADGLIVEVHPDPDRALSDGRQSLTFAGFAKAMSALETIAAATGRTMVTKEGVVDSSTENRRQ